MPALTTTRNYSDDTTLTETQLDAAFNSIEALLNTTKLDSSNIQTVGIATANLADLAVSTAKIANGAVTQDKLTYSVVSKTADYTATNDDDMVLCDATAGNITVTLYASATNSGKRIVVKKTDNSTNTVTIDGNASETIDGATTRILARRYDAAELVCDGSNWHVAGAAIPNSSVITDTGNGHGSSSTAIRRFTNSTTAGTDITYADSATLGGTFTINTPGLYAISYSDKHSTGAPALGISVNSNQLTTSALTITTAHRLHVTETPAARYAHVNAVAYLRAADVVRAHTDGTPDSTAAAVQFRIVRLGV